MMSVWKELAALREEQRANFQHIDRRFETLESKMDREFAAVRTEMAQEFAKARQERNEHFSRIGSRWGIHIESVLRQTVSVLLEKSYGVTVESKYINGEEYDLIIRNGEHILVELTTSVRRDIKRTART